MIKNNGQQIIGQIVQNQFPHQETTANSFKTKTSKYKMKE
jgi:hypothetical protein